MNYYYDIKILPNTEMRENVLLNKVFTKLHKGLYDLNADDIGVSFPEYKMSLGKKIRIHSTKERILEFSKINWLGELKGYCTIGEVFPVPSKVIYRTISRIILNMTNSKLRRLIKRGSITTEEAKQYKSKMYAQSLSQGYLELESNSTKQIYRLYIELGEPKDAITIGKFNHFGLSKEASIPWF